MPASKTSKAQSAPIGRVMAQLGMVMNLDKCIGCHTCSVTCKQAWTNRAGVEYVWFNNVETRPGGYGLGRTASWQ
jgi:nitrate reductase beta subunit